MSKKITVNWPTGYGSFPDMVSHVDGIQADWADSIAEEFQALEGELGLNPSRFYSNVSEYNEDHNHSAAGKGGWVNHYDLLLKGVNTHAEIDTHLADTNNPHTTTLEKARLAGYNFFGDVYFNGYQAVSMSTHKGTSFPGDPVIGQQFYRTDEKKLYMYNGATWEDKAGTHIASTDNPHVTTLEKARLAGFNFYGDVYFNGYQAVSMSTHKGVSFPGGPVIGQQFYRTDEKKFYTYNGTTWISFGVGMRSITRIVASDGTGDFTTIQAAIDDLPAGGGEVIIREGTYNISVPITVPSNVTLRGMGMSTKIFLANGSNCDMIQNSDQTGGNEKIRIEKLYLDGNKANNTGIYAGIHFKNTDYYLIQGVKIENICENGISLDLSDKGKVVLSEITGCSNRAGISLFGVCVWVSILGNTLKDCQNGIEFRASCSNIIIKGNEMYNCSEQGVRFDTGNSVRVTIAGNIMKDCQQGIANIPQSEQLVISHNVIEEMQYDGITIGGTYRSVINNNLVKNCSKAAAGTHSGIRLAGISDENVINGNRCFDDQTPKTQEYGISVATADCDDNVVVGNNLKGNLAGGLLDNGTNTEVGHNIE